MSKYLRRNNTILKTCNSGVLVSRQYKKCKSTKDVPKMQLDSVAINNPLQNTPETNGK